MDRPEFDNIKDFEEFSKYYWYRDELIKICKAHGLKAPSSKVQLNAVIKVYFSGESYQKHLSEPHKREDA